jgi:hypothetical protein
LEFYGWIKPVGDASPMEKVSSRITRVLPPKSAFDVQNQTWKNLPNPILINRILSKAAEKNNIT